jgi:tetratricopeptide (TPR) repeat protein
VTIYPSGTLIDNRYEVVQGPGEKPGLAGGMGVVYLCLDHQEDLPVALKTFQSQFLPNRAARDRFLREGTTWVELGRHPHIVRCHRVFSPPVSPDVYLVLEWVAQAEGKPDASLRAWLTPGQPLPVEQALLFALHVARGMRHATQQIPGLVHRDLKPENVLVGQDGRARVTDFGLAKTLADLGVELVSESLGTSDFSPSRTQLTQAGVAGTPLYMAPEQWTPGESLDARADIYALGCILYEMLTGQCAVTGKSLRQLERAHRAGQVGKLPRGLPRQVRGLVRRCLALGRGDRYGTWGEVEVVLAQGYERLVGQEAPAEAAAGAETRAERVAAGWSYNAIGASYLHIGKFDVALGYFERVVRIGQAEQERELEGAGLGNLGAAYHVLGDARRAIEFHQQHLAIAREIGDRRAEGRALSNLGATYHVLGDARRAIEFHEQRLAIAREIGDRRGEGEALGSLGSAYHVLGDAQRAIGFHQQRLAIAREIGDRRGEGRALSNLGGAYADLGDARRAIDFHDQSLTIAREIGDRAGEGRALGNLGAAYRALGDARRAAEFYKQGLATQREIGNVMEGAITNFNLALLLYEQGRRVEALRHAEYAAQAFAQVGHAPYAQRARQLVAQIRGHGR